jgi:hypothetical protein
VTYSKRYALQAILGLPTEDDDAEGATARGKVSNGAKEGPANFDPPKTIDPPKDVVDVTAIVEQCFFDYTTERSDMLPEHYDWDLEEFKKQLREFFMKLNPAKRKLFVWTKESAAEFAKKIKPDTIIKENKAA